MKLTTVDGFTLSGEPLTEDDKAAMNKGQVLACYRLEWSGDAWYLNGRRFGRGDWIVNDAGELLGAPGSEDEIRFRLTLNEKLKRLPSTERMSVIAVERRQGRTEYEVPSGFSISTTWKGKTNRELPKPARPEFAVLYAGTTLQQEGEPSRSHQATHYDLDGAAEYCDVSKRTIYNWLRDGLIAGQRSKAGRKISIPKAELDKWRKKTPRPEPD